MLLLALAVGAQLVFVLARGPQRALALSRTEDALYVQGGAEEAKAVDEGLLAAPTASPEPGKEPQEAGPPPGSGNREQRGPNLAGIPVSFGENAPLDVPQRAGMPRRKEEQDARSAPHARVKDQGALYRETLLAICYLDQHGGDQALTAAQAQHLLKMVYQMEAAKGAVPGAQKVVLETLTPEQLGFILEQRSAAGLADSPLTPEDLPRVARMALKQL